MKFPLFALLLGLMLTAGKCSDKSGGMDIIGTKWMLKDIAGQAVQMPAGMDAPWLQVAADKSLSGFGGCNNIMGKVELDGPNMAFPGVASTKKFCEASQKTEDAFMGALREARSFKVQDGLLKLMNGDKELASFTKGS